jgi:hypothetical protein
MAFPHEAISAAYKRYGARGAQAVILAYFLYRYARALADNQWAHLLTGTQCQNCWMVPVPYYVISVLTPFVVVGLEVWASRAPKKDFFLSRYLEWPAFGWAVLLLSLVYFWLECVRVGSWQTDHELPIYDPMLGLNPTPAITVAYTLTSLLAMYALARIAGRTPDQPPATEASTDGTDASSAP